MLLARALMKRSGGLETTVSCSNFRYNPVLFSLVPFGVLRNVSRNQVASICRKEAKDEADQ